MDRHWGFWRATKSCIKDDSCGFRIPSPQDAHKDPNPNPQKRIKELLDKEHIPYVDLLPAFRADKENLYFDHDGHWNARGHRRAAEAIYEWIKRNVTIFM